MSALVRDFLFHPSSQSLHRAPGHSQGRYIGTTGAGWPEGAKGGADKIFAYRFTTMLSLLKQD